WIVRILSSKFSSHELVHAIGRKSLLFLKNPQYDIPGIAKLIAAGGECKNPVITCWFYAAVKSGSLLSPNQPCFKCRGIREYHLPRRIINARHITCEKRNCIVF